MMHMMKIVTTMIEYHEIIQNDEQWSSMDGHEKRRGGGGEVCDSCQCSHMSNMPMHDVRMLKVLVWTQ